MEKLSLWLMQDDEEEWEEGLEPEEENEELFGEEEELEEEEWNEEDWGDEEELVE